MSAVSIKTKLKRKRSVVTDDTRISVITEQKRSKKDANESPFQFDNEEVEQCDAQKHMEQFQQASSSISQTMRDIHEVKSQPRTDMSQNDEVEKLRLGATLKFIMLKKLNRVAHVRCKNVRDSTTQAKEKMDSYHLQLQNLLYEATHLQKEITKCLQFKSKDEDIKLVPLEDFIKDAPPEISKVDDPENDEHKLKLARLDWELEQRKRLAAKLKDVEKERDKVEEEIKTKRDQLEGLEPKLSQILETTKPVQEYLNIPFDKTREAHEKASFLPRPLYVLYMQATAYQEACDKRLTVDIGGDIESAKAFKDVVHIQEEESDSDQEDPEGEKKTSKRRRKTVEARLTSVRDRVFRKHPFSISINLQCKDGSALTLTFDYLVQLKITTVKVVVHSGSGHNTTSSISGDLLSADNILVDLYPGDHGNTTPNPASQYELAELGVTDLSEHTQEVGHPYMWAQWLCGVQFLSDTAGQKALGATSAKHMHETVKRLRARLLSRLSLLRQLVSLEQKCVPVDQESLSLFPAKVTTRLTSFVRSTFSDFQAKCFTRSYCDSGLAQESHMYFTVTAERKSAKISCEVVIHPDYPVSPPVFIICITWGNTRMATTDYNILDLESEVNVHWEELIGPTSRDQLLTNQLQRFLMCVDVYLETESSIGEEDSAVEMCRNNIYPKLTRGPQRGKPYKYSPQFGFFIHR